VSVGACTDGSTGGATSRPTVTVTVTASARPSATADAGPVPLPPPTTGPVVHEETVKSPTGNIVCSLGPEGTVAECAVLHQDYEVPPRPADCDLDWAPWFSVGSTAAFGECRGDTFDFSLARPLDYGTTTTVGHVACQSRPDGMVCWNTGTRHGFRAARHGYEIF
jgi:hypothetical protein